MEINCPFYFLFLIVALKPSGPEAKITCLLSGIAKITAYSNNLVSLRLNFLSE